MCTVRALVVTAVPLQGACAAVRLGFIDQTPHMLGEAVPDADDEPAGAGRHVDRDRQRQCTGCRRVVGEQSQPDVGTASTAGGGTGSVEYL